MTKNYFRDRRVCRAAKLLNNCKDIRGGKEFVRTAELPEGESCGLRAFLSRLAESTIISCAHVHVVQKIHLEKWQKNYDIRVVRDGGTIGNGRSLAVGA